MANPPRLASSSAASAARRVEGDMVALPPPNLFEADILGEVVIVAAFAGEAPAYRPGGIAAGEHIGEKALLRRPAGLRLGLAVAARHGVVEPAMGGALVDVDVVAFPVRLQAVAEALHVGERDDVVGLAERAEHRAIDGGDHLVQRLGLAVVHLPFALGSGTVPHYGGADRHLRG